MALNKNILVTGGAGFMGSDFIRYLLSEERGIQKVVNLDLLTYAGSLDHLREVENHPGYHFVRGDIRDAFLIQELFQTYQFDTVVHFAAETHVDRSILSPRSFIETNVLGTYTLLEVLRSYPDTHFHLISTDEVYGDLPMDGLFTEESPYAPSSPYAASKAASDHLTLAYARTYDLSVTISHASNNFGKYQHKEKLIPQMIHRCLTDQPLPIYGAGNQVRDWLYVRDHSEAIIEILLKGKKGEVYNVGGQNERTNLEVVYLITDIIASFTKVDPSQYRKNIVHVDDRPGHDFRYAMEIGKIRETVGWEPKREFHLALTETIEEMICSYV